MDFSSFKLDIDELITEFAEGELKTVADMKKVWRERKFSYLFEARPSTNLAMFTQALYSHCISYLDPTNSLSHRLGGLYCLYFLYETQPFKPPFKIYISLGELRRLRAIVVDAKQNGIKVASAVVKRMLEKNSFLFGFVNVNEYSEKERVKELVDAQNARIQKMHELLFKNTEPERYLHMDMGMELDLDVLLKMSTEYEANKSIAVREACDVVDVENIKHIAGNKRTIGDEMRKIVEDWGSQKESFSQQMGSNQQPLPLLEPEQQRHDADDGDDLQHGGLLEFLVGNKPPLANGSSRHLPADQGSEEDHGNDEFEYVKDLEHQLSEGSP